MKKILAYYQRVPLKDYIVFTGIYLAIAGIWYLYEWIVFGELQKNAFDTVIALVLSVSLYFNYLMMRTQKKS